MSADGVGEAQGDVDRVGFEFHSLDVFGLGCVFGARECARKGGKGRLGVGS